MASEVFDKDYFENGIETGKSLYENYRWLPDRHYREAHWFAKYFNISLEDAICDYGCAKGFFVNALRKLGYCAYGYDKSKYAIENSHADVRMFCSNNLLCGFDYGFCKDVLEHAECQTMLYEMVQELRLTANTWLVIVPISNNGKVYDEPTFENDVTHSIRYNKKEWLQVFVNSGFKTIMSSNSFYGIKDNWQKQNQFANLFVSMRRK